MKPASLLKTLTATTAMFVTASLTAAPIVPGTEIGVDFGPTAPTNNFNQVNPDPAAGGSIAAGGLVNTTAVTVDGVGFSWAGSYSFFNNNDAISIAGQPAVFNESNLTDWIGISSTGTNPAGVITLTFTGLNNALTYDLIIGAGFANNIADTLWASGSESGLSDTSSGPNSFVTLTGLTTDGSGNLVITGTGTGTTTALRKDIAVVSALHLTAVPEPGSLALLGLGGLLIARRRRD